MKQKLSFSDFIKENYENDIADAVGSFVSDNPDELDCSTNFVDTPEEAELLDFDIKWINVSDAPGMGILFDVIIEAEIAISETVRRNQEKDSDSQWFRVSCSGDLNGGLKNFEIEGVTVYNPGRDKSKTALTDSLVPYMHRRDLDAEATTFLEKHFPDALDTPMPLPVETVVKNMGLSLYQRQLSKNHTIFGQIYFDTCQTQLYDENSGHYIPATVEAKTILYDPDVYFLRNLGCVRNTIIHECVHWDLHRKAFELQKLYNETSCTIRCNVVEGEKPENKRTPEDWMEWQANALTPRILMPLKTAGMKAEEFIAKHKEQAQTDNLADIIEPVISDMAEFFQVSKLSAKIRMLDLGYEEATSAFVYANDRHIMPHAFKPGTLNRGQTFIINAHDALMAYGLSGDLRKMLDSGRYLYVDSMYCINDPKYVQTNELGKPELTEYAIKHADECCLVFDVEVMRNPSYGAKKYTECVLYRDAAHGSLTELQFKKNAQNQSVEERAQELAAVEETAALLRSLPTTFSETLVVLMKHQGITVEDLAEAACLSPKTIQRLRNEENRRKSIPMVVSLCIGLSINPILSHDLIGKAGLRLTNSDEDVAYQFLLNSCCQKSIYECNEILNSYGFDPLGTEE